MKRSKIQGNGFRTWKHLFAGLIFIFGVLTPVSLHAQTGAIRKAQKLMEAYDFQSAIQLLEKKLERRPSSPGAALLGECYRRSGRFAEAETWYRRVEDWSEAPPPYLLNFARTLQRAGNYAEALSWYERYLAILPNDQVALEQSRACRNIRQLQQQGLGWWDVQALTINSPYREFSPALCDGDLVFCSDRPTEGLSNYQDAWTGEGFLDLFRAERKELDPALCGSFTYHDPELFEASLSSRYHEASAHFGPGSEVVYFTTNALSSGKKRDDAGLLRLQILYARRLPRNKGWTDPISLPINSDEYSVMHPALSPDGQRLFFASDMPGGLGGLDLYYIERINDLWGPPVNLGPGINTTGNEVFPYIAGDGGLYFSSDGWSGLGGMDIFSAQPGEGGAWRSPVNPGAPLNSSSDDFGLIWERGDQCGYFSSDRMGGTGKDDLYGFRKIAHPMEVQIRDEKSGIFLAGGTLSANCRADTLTLPDGQAGWDIPHNACCELVAEAPGYLSEKQTRCTYNLGAGELVKIEFWLRPKPVYLLEGIVFDHATGLPVDGALVQVFERDTGREFATYTTNFTGRFEVFLKDDACYHIRASRSGFPPVEAEGPCLDLQSESQTYSYKLYLKSKKNN